MTEEFRKALAVALRSRMATGSATLHHAMHPGYLARAIGISVGDVIDLMLNDKEFREVVDEIINEVQEKLAKKQPVDKVEQLKSLINANFGDDTVVEVTYQYTVNRNIATIIKTKGLSQRDVARRAGFSEAVFSNIVNNRRKVYADEVCAIASALGSSIEELFHK